jgi:hypothetical protein
VANRLLCQHRFAPTGICANDTESLLEMASVPVGVRRESDITTGRPNPNGGITLEEPIEELKQLAEARGLRVEEGDNYNEFYLFRGDEMLDPVWYLGTAPQ